MISPTGDWRELLLQLQHHSELSEYADTLAEQAGGEVPASIVRAHALVKQRRYSEAQAAFAAVWRLTYFEAADGLAYAEACRGTADHHKAIEVLRSVSGPATEGIVFWLAVSLAETGQEQEAANLLTQLPVQSRTARTKHLLGYLELGLKGPAHAGDRSPDARVLDRHHASSVALALLDYKSPDVAAVSRNIGDYVQTLALARHLARHSSDSWHFPDEGIQRLFGELRQTWPSAQRDAAAVSVVMLDRDSAWSARLINSRIWTFVAGWFHHRPFGYGTPLPFPHHIKPFFVGIHLHDHASLTAAALAQLREYAPIGCRDWATVGWLLNAGVDAFFAGCPTLTLALGERRVSGETLFVDAALPDDGGRHVCLGHEYDGVAEHSAATNLAHALQLLRRYRDAARVTTSRLHCYLPCLALGTPVTLVARRESNRRFDGLTGLTHADVLRIQSRLGGLIQRITALVLRKTSERRLRSEWKCITAPWVDEARALLNRHRMKPEPAPPARTRRFLVSPRRATIVSAFDANYAKLVPSFIRSIRSHASLEPHFVFLVRHVDSSTKTFLAELASGLARFIDMSSRPSIGAAHLAAGTTPSTMDRLYLPTLLRNDDIVAYIDPDTVVLGDIADLIAITPAHSGISARPNPAPQMRLLNDAINSAAKHLDYHTAHTLRLTAAAQMRLAAPMFNAGVLVLSLETLRRRRFSPRAMDVVRRFRMQDEQAMNWYSQGSFRALPPSWNMMPYLDHADTANLIHWAGSRKPWLRPHVRLATHWHAYTHSDDPR